MDRRVLGAAGSSGDAREQPLDAPGAPGAPGSGAGVGAGAGSVTTQHADGRSSGPVGFPRPVLRANSGGALAPTGPASVGTGAHTTFAAAVVPGQDLDVLDTFGKWCHAIAADVSALWVLQTRPAVPICCCNTLTLIAQAAAAAVPSPAAAAAASAG